MPVVTGSIGSISKSSKQYKSNKPGQHYIKELQQTILDTAHTMRTVIM